MAENRSQPWRPGLKLTDAILSHQSLSPAAKLVLSVSLAYPNRNPSLSQLEDVLPVSRDVIADAQDELEDTGLVEYDRPRHPWERHPKHPAFQRSNKLNRVAVEADPHHASTRDRWIELPGELLASLPRGSGKKNASLYPLVAAVYAMEQLRRGAVHVPDNVVAWRLGISERQVRRIKEELRREAFLIFAFRAPPCNAYTLPGGTPGKPEDPSQLDPSRTRTLQPFTLNERQELLTYANDTDLVELARLRDEMIPADASAAWLYATLDALDREQPADLPARAVIDALKRLRANPPRRVSRDEVDRSGHASPDDRVDRSGHLSLTVLDTGLLPPTTTSTTSREAEPSARPSAEDEDEENPAGEGGRSDRPAASARPSRSPQPQRWEWPAEWAHVFYWSAEETHRQIEAIVASLVTSYGETEAKTILRAVCLDSGGSGATVLAALREAFAHRDPETTADEPDEAPAYLLADVFQRIPR